MIQRNQRLLICNLWPSKVKLCSAFREYLFQKRAKMCPVIKTRRLYRLDRHIIDFYNFGIKITVFVVVTKTLLSEHPSYIRTCSVCLHFYIFQSLFERRL